MTMGRSWAKTLLALAHRHLRLLCYCTSALVVLAFCLDPVRFAAHYDYVALDKIAEELEKSFPQRDNSCAINIVHGRRPLLYPDEHPREEDAAIARRLDVLPGGQWRPTAECNALFKVAIILCYRKRQTQLKIFINYIHPFLQAQRLDYCVFVVEQSPDGEFNRAKLFNTGFVEASKAGDFDCFIFHDVDLIPQNANNIYACTKAPRHMSSSVNTFRYNLPYTGLFGGAIAISRAHFQRVNGFSNIYYGWGGEDDDLYDRLRAKGLEITRFGPDVAQYYMLTHQKEKKGKNRYTNLKTAAQRVDTDGISDLEYKVLEIQLRPLYTWILVHV